MASTRVECPLEEVFACVLPQLPPTDRSALRSVSAQLRGLVSGACTHLTLSSTVYMALASCQLLKQFPRVLSLKFVFASAMEVKSATMFILTSPSDQSAQLTSLAFTENRAAMQQLLHLHGAHNNHGGYGQPESRFQQYGYNSGARPAPQTLDFTEPVLAAICACRTIKSVSVDKTALLDTEAAALARLTGLEELRLSTNCSAQPLRRPLVQLMLGSMTRLRSLALSYIRDTTADMAASLPRLTQLTRLSFQYAYWGESGAGERVMAALAKHARQLAELHLYECCVNDDMLGYIMGITTLRRLHVQDEDAAEESCPTNKGLARITQLRRLEVLELFGEELQLDGELLGLLAQLPALRHLAMAGLDSLQADDADAGGLGGGEAGEDLEAEVEEMALSSSSGDDEETEESCSYSMGGDEVTSRPQLSPRSQAVAGGGSCSSGAAPHAMYGQLQALQQRQGPHPIDAGMGAVSAAPPAAAPCPCGTQAQTQARAASPDRATAAAPAGPLQVLRHLDTLRLYGPSALAVLPPPLALLLPQPQLRHLKLSACASHADLQALSTQTGLHKLILSHTSVPQLYPPGACTAPTAGGARSHSILGRHSDLASGLSSLRVLRLKDLPGLLDCHMADLAVALRALPELAELKLRTLGTVSDAGLAALAGVTQLRRLKLYALGDGVTEAGVAQLAASLPRLEELKVKDCRRVGPSLRGTVVAYRSAASAAGSGIPAPTQRGAQLPVVRFGAQECGGSQEASA